MALPNIAHKSRNAQKRSRKPQGFAVIMKQDMFGWGYLVHRMEDVPAAERDGWVVVSDTNLPRREADQLRAEFASGLMTVEDMAV